MTGPVPGVRLTAPATATALTLPAWVRLVRADNPGPMTLDGTNTWVLGAGRTSVVVDPGPLDEAHLTGIAGDTRPELVLVTHGHPDHVAGLARFTELTGARVAPLADGASVQAGGLTVTALATPGHTADSMSFVAEAGGTRVILTGDTILGRGTTVVAWPDGDLGAYLVSLRRLAGFGPVPVLPGHGPALADCGAAAEYYLAHRTARLDQVRAALAGGARSAADLVAVVYADVDRALWPAAELSVRAQLAYLGVAPEAGAEAAAAAAYQTLVEPPAAAPPDGGASRDREHSTGDSSLDRP